MMKSCPGVSQKYCFLFGSNVIMVVQDPSYPYTLAIDIWNIGCIFAEVLTGKLLFPGKNFLFGSNVIMDVQDPSYPQLTYGALTAFFAEVLTGKPLFPGKNVVHQLDLINDLLGTPPMDTIFRFLFGSNVIMVVQDPSYPLLVSLDTTFSHRRRYKKSELGRKPSERIAKLKDAKPKKRVSAK
ncbi:hypothetical protein ACS0TY_030313 [Phlomoides rotata]